MATNEYGFDHRYFERWLHRMLQGINRYTPEEAYNEFSSMAETARPKEIQSLRTKLAEAERKIEALYDAGMWGIQHVGAANYQSREDEAIARLQSVYDDAAIQQAKMRGEQS